MNKLAHGVTIETIRNRIFLCDKYLNRWVEISAEARNCIENELSGKKSYRKEEVLFIDYLVDNGYIVNKSIKEETLDISSKCVQVIVETGDFNSVQRECLAGLTESNLILKYKFVHGRPCYTIYNNCYHAHTSAYLQGPSLIVREFQRFCFEENDILQELFDRA